MMRSTVYTMYLVMCGLGGVLAVVHTVPGWTFVVALLSGFALGALHERSRNDV